MSRAITLAGYAVLALAMAAKASTLPAVLDRVVRITVVRWSLVAGWLWFGWHVFVRASH